MGKSVAAVTAVVVSLVVLFVIWRFEGAHQKKDVEASVSQEFSYQIEKSADTGDLLLTCSEEIMNKPIAAFARWLKIEGPPLQVPSGHLLIPQLNTIEIGEEFKPAQRVVRELLKRHSPRKVVLVAHTNCVYYDTMAAWQDSLATVRQKQVDDLRATAKLVREWLVTSEVQTYLAEEENGKLVFHKIN